MTRLAIVGSSHVGAIRQCDDYLRKHWPGVQIDYFALPGAPYRRAERTPDGIFHARPANPAEAKLIARINGATEIDLTPHDLIWVTGNRYGLGRVLGLLAKYDILEMPRTGRKAVISQAFFNAAMRAEIDASCDRIATQFGRDKRLIFTPAPYPAETVREKGPFHEAALTHIFTHPERDAIFALYEAKIRDALAARSFGFMAQPPQTLAAPFATKAKYLNDARDFRDPTARLKDARHMNADYGLALTQSFAELHLGSR